MSYNRFFWWRTLPRHQKKDHRCSIIARIENGDFEYPWDVKKDLEHAQSQLRDLETGLENRMSRSSKADIEHEKEQLFRMKRVKIVKLKDELIEEDIKRTEEFKQALYKTLYPYMSKAIKDEILDEVYERKIIKDDKLNRGDNIVKISIQNTIEVYRDYEEMVCKYVKEKRMENTVAETV